MTDGIAAQICEIAADIFGVPRDSVDLETTPETLEVWDSLQQLNLLLELEASFNVKFTARETSRMTSIRDIADMIQSKLQRN
jgi:acyl carrier protein